MSGVIFPVLQGIMDSIRRLSVFVYVQEKKVFHNYGGRFEYLSVLQVITDSYRI